MRLFSSLWRIGKPKIRLPDGFKGPKGHIFRGKYRIVKKVTDEAVKNLQEQIKIEENNMLLLRHPFLTKEQSFGHAKELKKNEKWYMEKLTERERQFTENPKKNKSIVNHLSFLRVNEDWDKIPS